MPPSQKTGLAGLIRQAGQDAKREAVKNAPLADGQRTTSADNIFSILEYIESEWGLNMTLYPAQRFIVKLYYFLELDDKLPEEDYLRIKVRDVLTGSVKYTLTERQYLEYLFNEGRCNIGVQDHERRELVLAIGRRAGKCVTGDTLVLTSKGLHQIEDLGKAPVEGVSGLVDLEVAQQGTRRAPATHFYNGGVKPIIRLRTSSGYAISGTANHRVKVMTTEGSVEWRYLDEISYGDQVALHRNTDLWASEYLDVTAYHNDDGRKQFELPKIGRASSREGASITQRGSLSGSK